MRLNEKQVHEQLSELEGWQLDKNKLCIWQDFKCKDFYQTMTFVNKVADIAHTEDHHPDMEIGYNHCMIRYTTHSLSGLSEKDFICARHINALKN